LENHIRTSINGGKPLLDEEKKWINIVMNVEKKLLSGKAGFTQYSEKK
jgi:hypothetical protein